MLPSAGCPLPPCFALRWCNQLNPEVKKEPFSQWEDAVIIKAHREHGNKWASECPAVRLHSPVGTAAPRPLGLTPHSPRSRRRTPAPPLLPALLPPPLASHSDFQAAARSHRQRGEEPLEQHAQAQVQRWVGGVGWGGELAVSWRA